MLSHSDLEGLLVALGRRFYREISHLSNRALHRSCGAQALASTGARRDNVLREVSRLAPLVVFSATATAILLVRFWTAASTNMFLASLSEGLLGPSCRQLRCKASISLAVALHRRWRWIAAERSTMGIGSAHILGMVSVALHLVGIHSDLIVFHKS